MLFGKTGSVLRMSWNIVETIYAFQGRLDRMQQVEDYPRVP